MAFCDEEGVRTPRFGTEALACDFGGLGVWVEGLGLRGGGAQSLGFVVQLFVWVVVVILFEVYLRV